MKHFSFFLFITGMLALSVTTYAQESSDGWLSFTDRSAKVNFKLPVAASQTDTLHTTMYVASVDSLLGLQVHIFDSAYFSSDVEMMRTALEQNDQDTLRAIASLLLLATNSELTSLDEISVHENRGLEVSIRYNELAADVPTHTFIRYFLYDHKFVVFSLSGSEEDMLRLMDYKNHFFDSIAFF